MSRSFRTGAALLATLAASAGRCWAVAPPALWLDPTQPVEARLDALLPTLTTEQLAAQTLHLWFTQTMPDLMAKYNQTGVGASYILKPTENGTCNADPACNLAARNSANQELMAGVGIPVTFVSETLHSPWVGQGVVMPMPVTMGATWNASLLTEVGKAIAAEATACGITRGFSPEINVCTDPRFGRTQENLGGDALHVGTLGVALAIGLQGGTGDSGSPSEYLLPGGLSLEAKHLVAYGSGDADGAPADMSPMTLHDVYLRPWRMFFAAGGRGAMLSHNSINGIPAHMSHEIMTEVIRTAWNHSNVFFASDFNDVDDIMKFNVASTLEDAAVLAANAGLDQALGGSANTFLAAAEAVGKIDRSVLERAARNILREKFAGGLFDKNFDGKSDGNWGNVQKCRAYAAGGVLDLPAHRAIARRVAQEGTVLLKNGLDGAELDSDAPYHSSATTAGCNFANSSDCYGNELGTRTGVPSADACCALCQNTTGCKAAVWIPSGAEPNAETCLLKNGCSNPQTTADRVRCSLPRAGGDISLPLTNDKWQKIKTLAIVGPNANNSAQQQNSYSSGGAVLTTIASSAAEHVPSPTKVQYAALDSSALIETSTLGTTQQQMIDEAVTAANSSDLVIAVLGDTMKTCGEGTDRVDLDLPGVQMQLLAALIATHKPIVVVLVHGRPVTFGSHNSLLDDVSVVLASWIGGEDHGPAIWSILNGDFNPSGRLAQVGYTVARSTFNALSHWY